MKESIWSEFREKPNFESLREDITCDVLVIGGGMAGVLTAHFLQERGREVVLVEAKKIGGGITKNTTAFLTAQHDMKYGTLMKLHGRERAKAYLEANLDAVETFAKMAETVDCDFERKTSHMYSREGDLEGERRTLEELGFHAELTEETGLPFRVGSALRYPGMAQFHPLKFLYALARDLKVYEDTFVEDIQYHTAYTEKHTIRFKQAVVATHFPFLNRTGGFFIKLFQQRSYVVALEGTPDVGGTYIDERAGGFYFRNYGGLLLVGLGAHRTGAKTKAPDELKAFVREYYPKVAVKYAWANQDCVSLDGLPYVGKYGRLPDVYTLSGFNLWGMTGSMAGAKILSALLNGEENPYAEAFRTGRSVLRKQLFLNFGSTVKEMVRPTLKRCPHLGCALVYNEREHSWDCQCHGSRFDRMGKLIDNPALHDADV